MRIAIIGRTDILYRTMEAFIAAGHEVALVVTSKEAPEYIVTADDFKNFAEKKGIPFFRTPKLMDIIDDIKSIPDIDIGISMNFSGIIEQEIIDCFSLGILNAHGGDLPRYRGNACQAWAIINGEEKIGLCIHSMIGGELDNGNIVARDYLPIDINTKVGKVWNWMGEKTPGLFLQAAENLSKNPNFVLEVQSKDPAKALRCYPRTPDDGQIDWSQSAEEIVRLVNASGPPYAGAFCFYEGEKIIIWDAKIASHEHFVGLPGQVALINEGGIEVLTGNGKVYISMLQRNGTDVSPSSFIRSTRARLK